jgi:hypothetical protein
MISLISFFILKTEKASFLSIYAFSSTLTSLFRLLFKLNRVAFPSFFYCTIKSKFVLFDYIDTKLLYSCNTFTATTSTLFYCNATVISPITLFQLFVDFGDTKQLTMGYAGQGYYTIQTNVIKRTYTRNGTYRLFLRLIPSRSDDTVNTAAANETIVVTGEPSCGEPIAEIQDRRTPASTIKHMRSNALTVIGLPFYDCAVQFTETKEWYVEELDPITFNPLNNVSLINNPSKFFSAIGFRPNTLLYGVYKFTLVISMSFTDRNTSQSVTRFSRESTYIQIIYSGIDVYQSGQLSYEIGSDQILEFDPVQYSVDLDEIANPASLDYWFYCYIYNVTNNSIVSNPDLVDLDLYKLKYNQSGLANQTCFQTAGLI